MAIQHIRFEALRLRRGIPAAFAALVTALALVFSATALPVRAATLSVVHEFAGSDGTYPDAQLLPGRGNALYGTTRYGGISGNGQGYGTIYRITPQGRFKVLHVFSGGDGGEPMQDGGLVRDKRGNLYGTTAVGGLHNAGTLFRLSKGGAFATLHHFDGGQGGRGPRAGLTFGPDGALYGTSQEGGLYGRGTVFRYGFDGTFMPLYHFGAAYESAHPHAGLTLGNDGLLYGSTTYGGPSDAGVLFRIGATGEAFAILHGFQYTSLIGGWPQARLVLAPDGRFYGATSNAAPNNGNLFRLAPDGTVTAAVPSGIDGDRVLSGLTVGHDGLLYGVSVLGGAHGYGKFFRITQDRQLQELLSFDPAVGKPLSTPVETEPGVFFGTALPYDDPTRGSVYRIVLEQAPQVRISGP